MDIIDQLDLELEWKDFSEFSDKEEMVSFCQDFLTKFNNAPKEKTVSKDFIRIPVKDILDRQLRNTSAQQKFLKDYPVEPYGWMVGGSVRNLIEDKPFIDIDLFFKSKEAQEDYLNTIRGWQMVDKNDTLYEFKVDNEFKVQIVNLHMADTPEDLISQFDFTVCQFALDGNDIVTTPMALYDLSMKQLVINTLSNPIKTMRRAFKYKLYGYNCPDSTIIEIMEATKNMDLNLLKTKKSDY